MDKPLRILLVEDSTADAELEERELKIGGLIFVSRRVQTREDLVRSLNEFVPDLVISDYSMPGMSGMDVLQIVREIRPDVPFIFASGTIGEERAIESLKSGATDYVLKDSISSLLPKVRRALKEVEERARKHWLEEQLRQAQKMEAVGRLAGGVAHDFNNLLLIINGYTELVLGGLPGNSPERAKLEEVLGAAQSAAALTRQLLAFSRKQVLSPVVLNINEVISGMAKMMGRLLGEDIRLVPALGPSLGARRVNGLTRS